jgi:uncharacterized membrane protein
MKIFGHPVHPLLVHFPTALLPMDFALSLIYTFNTETSFALAGFYCLVGGTVMGFVAVLTGLTDLLSIPKNNKAAWATGLYHGFLNGTVIIVFAVFTYKTWQAYPQINISTASLVVKAILIVTLFTGNYFGGRLIYQYHIGLNTKQKEHEHYPAQN